MDGALAIATYDAERGHLAFYADSYRGGESYRNPSSLTIGTTRTTRWVPMVDENGGETGDFEQRAVRAYRTYLVPHPGELDAEFNIRRSLAAYINVISMIVDAYTDAVTGHVVRDLGALGGALGNTNGRGRGWAAHVQEVARWTAVYGYFATVIDAPKVNPAQNRAEEERLRVGLRATLVHPTAIAWVCIDHDGAVVEFAFVDQPQVAEAVAPATQVVRFWRYTTETWEVHELAVDVARGWGWCRGSLNEKTRKDGGPLAPGLRGRCPVVFSFFREDTTIRFPRGTSLICDAADLARQIYNELSWVEEIHRKTSFPFLAVPEPDAAGDLDPKTRKQIGPDKALGYNGKAGSPEWVQPSAESTQELRNHIVFLVMIAFRTTGLEVTADQGSPTQSGVALRIRSRDFESRCTRFADNMEAYERQCFDLARAILTSATAEPALTYSKRFVLPDSTEALDGALKLLEKIAPELGTEGKLAIIRQALDSAMSLSDEQMAKVLDEIRARMEKPSEAPQKELFAYDYDAGIVYVDEARATKGLAPLADGKGQVPVSQWKAQTTALAVSPPSKPPPPASAPEAT